MQHDPGAARRVTVGVDERVALVDEIEQSRSLWTDRIADAARRPEESGYT